MWDVSEFTEVRVQDVRTVTVAEVGSSGESRSVVQSVQFWEVFVGEVW